MMGAHFLIVSVTSSSILTTQQYLCSLQDFMHFAEQLRILCACTFCSLINTVQRVMRARSKFLRNLRMKVQLTKISAGREKFLYFLVSKIWPKHSLGTLSSENRLCVSLT